MYTLYLLAMHPDVQDEMHKEIEEICGSQPPGFKDIPNLLFTLCVVYEAMRLFPVVGTLPHRTESNQLLLGEHFIPKTHVLGRTWLLSVEMRSTGARSATNSIPHVSIIGVYQIVLSSLPVGPPSWMEGSRRR